VIVQTNIGLESHGIGTSIVNQLTANAIGEKNRIIASDCKLSSGGDWKPELILIQRIEISDFPSFVKGFENLCSVLGEDCIAVEGTDHGFLIFSPSYNGERFSFNSDFFITL
jgi:hypothetical protein